MEEAAVLLVVAAAAKLLPLCTSVGAVGLTRLYEASQARRPASSAATKARSDAPSIAARDRASSDSLVDTLPMVRLMARCILCAASSSPTGTSTDAAADRTFVCTCRMEDSSVCLGVSRASKVSLDTKCSMPRQQRSAVSIMCPGGRPGNFRMCFTSFRMPSWKFSSSAPYVRSIERGECLAKIRTHKNVRAPIHNTNRAEREH